MFLAQNEYERLLVVSHTHDGDFFWKQKKLFSFVLQNCSANAYFKGKFQVNSLSIHMSELTALSYYIIEV